MTILEAVLTYRNGDTDTIDPVLSIEINNGYHTYTIDLDSVASIELRQRRPVTEEEES